MNRPAGHSFSHLALGLGALATALCVSVCRAETGVMTWGDVTGCAPTWTAASLVFSNARGTICTSSGNDVNAVSSGSPFSNDVDGLRVVHEAGLPFTPLSIQLGEYSRTVINPAVEFVGHREDGSTVSVFFPLDGVADGPGGAPDFQTHFFPPGFANIVRLEVTSTGWSFDEFVFTTNISPPLPTDQRLGPHYRAAVEQLSKSIHDEIYIVAREGAFASGFSAPNSTRFALDDNSAFIPGTYSPHYARTQGKLYFVPYLRNAVRVYQDGETTTLATPQDTTEAGWPMTYLDLPRPSGGSLVFLGYNTEAGDSFGLFRKTGDTTVAFVTAQTELPMTATYHGISTPFDFPREIATTPNGLFVAFDTSLVASPNTKRVYVTSPVGGPVQYIVGEDDVIPIDFGSATVLSVDDFSFTDDGLLEVRATLNNGPARLYYAPWGLDQVALSRTVAPVNAGKTVSGVTIPAAFSRPAILATPDGEIYQKSEGHYFRVLGVGDQIEGETLRVLELKAMNSWTGRLLVEVRYASSPAVARILEIELAEPITHPPRFGAPYVHPDSGDWYIPLSHTTADKSRWLAKSNDLKTWERLWRIDQVLPIQNILIPREHTQGARVFFRVEEE